MAGCQTGDNPWAKEEAPLSVSQASAFPVHRASVTASCLGAGEGGSEGGGTPPPPPVQRYFLSSHLCSLFQAEEEWIQRLPDAPH